MILGYVVLIFAGLFQGSFGRGYKNHKPFSWSVFWGVYNILCIIVSTSFVAILIPDFFSLIIKNGILSCLKPFLCGVVWGLSAICFSKAIDKIGMSLVYGISMGISTISGSITPMITNNAYPNGNSMLMFLISLVLTLAGVGIITVAGVKRDGATKGSVLGLIFSILSGLGSGIMNLGFSYGTDIFRKVNIANYSQSAVSALKWLPVLVGGCIAGLIYCIMETTVLKEWKTLTEKRATICTLKLFATSLVWYFALILYGVATVLLGKTGNSVGWILFNSLALIVSVFWGLKTGEWKNKKKTILYIGSFVLILSWFFICFDTYIQ